MPVMTDYQLVDRRMSSAANNFMSRHLLYNIYSAEDNGGCETPSRGELADPE